MSDKHDMMPINKDGFDGITFYASADGTVTGMSVNGLAELCGVRENTLRSKVNQMVRNKQDENPPEPSGSEDLSFAPEDVVQANFKNKPINVISSEKCTEVLYYYAFESEQVSDAVRERSRHAFKTFAKKGMHNWILESVSMAERDDSMLSATVLEMLTTLHEEMKDLKKETVELRTIRSKTKTNLIGLDELLDDLAENSETNNPMLLPTEDGMLSLEGWLLQEGYTLTSTRFRSLAKLVAANYKTMYKKDPERRHFRMPDGSTKYNVYVYPTTAHPIMRLCLGKLVQA